MSKFKIGDAVVCIDTDGADYGLKLHRCYVVSHMADWDYGPTEVFLEGDKLSWMESRFELLSEWKKHQKENSQNSTLASEAQNHKKVNLATELELAKHQVAILQAWRKEALYLLRHAAIDVNSASLKIEINKFLGEN